MNGPGARGPGPESGPADLRLVAPAMAAWVAAALALDAPAGWTAAGVGLGVTGAGLLMLAGCRRSPRSPWRPATAAAAALLCAAAAAGVAGLQRAEARAGPVEALAREHARVSLELTVASDPRTVGGGQGPPLLMLDAVVTRVTGPDGSRTRVETPVRVLAGHPHWARLQPSTRVAVVARLAPARGGERAVALVRPPGGTPPGVRGGPDAAQRVAGSLRAGLRTATEGLPADARALLPGLVVGDTSRVPPDLHEAFRATDLLHLLAVSGSNLTVVLFLLIGPPATAQHAERRGLAPRLGLSLRATAPERRGPDAGVRGGVPAGAERAAGRRLRCGHPAGPRDRAAQVPDPRAGRRRAVPRAVRALAGPELRLPALRPGHRGPLDPRAPVERGPPAARGAAPPRRGTGGRRGRPGGVRAGRRGDLRPGEPRGGAVQPAGGARGGSGDRARLRDPRDGAALHAGGAAARLVRGGVPAGWIAAVARAGAGFRGAELAWPGGVTGGLSLAAATLAVVGLGGWFGRRKWACAAVALLLLLAVLRPPQLTRGLTGWPPPEWSYVQCAVGQGDAAVLAVGPGTALVVDAGPEPGPVDDCLRILGVRRVPLLLLTHFHADHVGGLSGVLRGRAVGVIQTTALAEPPGQAESVRRTAAAAGVPVVTASAGERRRAGPLEWEVLWPPPEGPPPDGPNDASVALLVRGPGLTLLLLGDLEPPAQQALLKARPELGPVDVLKVAHHGSAHQDPALQARVRPRIAIVPVGAGNRYGHPAPDTLARLRALGGDRPAHRYGRLRGHLRKRRGDEGLSGRTAPDAARAYRAAPLCLPTTRQHDRMRFRQSGPRSYSTGVHQPCSDVDGGWRRPEVPAHTHPRPCHCRPRRGS
ncbi:hypothetical protein GCM10020254_55880 [Streptomyces goshikiensis]